MKKFIILSSLLLGAWSVSAVDPDAARLLLGPPCTPESFRFFPPGSVDSESGPIYSYGSLTYKVTSSEMGTCIFYTDKEGPLHTGSYLKFDDKRQADVLFEGYSKTFPGKAYPGVSCDRLLPPDPNEEAKNPRGSAIYAQKGNYIFIIVSSYEIERVTGDAEYACAQVKSVSSSKSPSPSASPGEPADPIIDSFTPETVSAGVKQTFDENTGNVIYTNTVLALTITGKNLQGAVLSANDAGVNGKPGIEFRNIQSNESGTKVRGHMIVHSTAKEGKNRIMLTNEHGRSDTFDLNVTITGTQYLKRAFSKENVKFFGEWPEVMPTEDVLDTERRIREGLRAINKPTYKKLGIIIHVYETGFWKRSAEERYCGLNTDRGFSAAGCASARDNITYIMEDDLLAYTILHEAAHKLDFYYKGSYVLNSPPNNFEKEWRAQLKDLQNCKYLPLKITAWSDGLNLVSRCGFAQSYGAYLTDKGLFYEDVATFAEQAYVPYVRGGDQNDPRYLEKINLIRKYGF